MLSSVIVVFAVVELVVLPPVLSYSLWFEEPTAAGASLGLTVKTDGADAASGAITDQLMRTRAMEELGQKHREAIKTHHKLFQGTNIQVRHDFDSSTIPTWMIQSFTAGSSSSTDPGLTAS